MNCSHRLLHRLSTGARLSTSSKASAQASGMVGVRIQAGVSNMASQFGGLTNTTFAAKAFSASPNSSFGSFSSAPSSSTFFGSSGESTGFSSTSSSSQSSSTSSNSQQQRNAQAFANSATGLNAIAQTTFLGNTPVALAESIARESVLLTGADVVTSIVDDL
ncbi:hypothetical protein BCR33DRAFT_719995 [Rhizoclosmatium globosum]|uniref:Uncharacterized protein n=1 Tax=Rhizoclosmatium globosum TaxID=329046 RepID=A0A1Y2BXQ2_9FUNG|nr:hypothetical protein BCR33DRAFT_719995 [Rhizoclosmatium globosum]|eukprot:ORY39528.1 hypothetical protein BCR33DRAFT_719995 [Rhizoclosmatium globosum]